FNETKDAQEEMTNVDKLTLEEIVNYFDMKNTELRRKYNKKDASVSYVPEANRLKQLIQSFKENPMMGACLQSHYATTISNGASRGHFSLRSGNSGSGKTTITVADMCELCATEIYNSDKGIWEENQNRQGAGLHIHTESNTETEVSVIYLAYISNVDRNKITQGSMTKEEEERVLRATEILEESQIFFEYDPRFTVSSIRENLKEYVDKYDIFVAFFDYLQVNGVFNVKMIQEMKNFIPDHQALLNLSEEIKLMAEQFNIFIMSGTQCNDNIKTADFCDESCLSASKAIKNKIDFGCISTYLKPKEIKQVEEYIEKRGFGNLRPNRVCHVYKGRFNSTGYEKIKIFQHVFLGTGRVIDLFCTDENNELIKIKKTMKLVE
ncbi:MAG: DnaB-like helicase C-terminal domain-containing protein, partial [Bacteroidales bacterium]